MNVSVFKKTIYVLCMIVCFGAFAEKQSYASPVDSRVRTFTQPDGSTFSGRAIGDEWGYWVETLDRYTIVQNQQGYWTYATHDPATGWFAS